MGAAGSVIYGRCRRLLMRYNAENRAHKFLDYEKLTPAPRHPTFEREYLGVSLSEKELQELHGKNEQLNEYLKKVYLTSTSTITGSPSKRPKPKKENEILKTAIFMEPKEPSPGHCTLTNVIEILLKHQEDSQFWSINEIAKKYKLNKKDTVQLLMYYSLFTIERLEFANAKPQETTESDKELIEFEVNNKLGEKPLRQIEGKK